MERGAMGEAGAAETRRQLLGCFRPTLAWAERECVQRTWRTIRGEAPLGSKALPAPPPLKLTEPVGGLRFTGVGRIFGLHNFETCYVLGEGNYSHVVEAIVKPTRERVAFKIVDKQKMNRHKKGDEVIIEKHVLSTANHPSIIKLFHTFQDSTALYMALELVPGGELWAVCNRRGVHPCHAAYWTAQIAEALQHLHERHIIHRDVKPENVLLTREGRAKLIDFGSAKLMDAIEPDAPLRLSLGLSDKFKDFVGTPDYMAPEAINNKGTDFRADLWSLGCFVCMLLAGQPPFNAGSDYLTFRRVQARLFNMPEGLPPDASDLIDRLLQMDPQQRLGGGAELSEPADGRHATLLAHPFFSRARSGLQAQQKTAVSTDGLTAPSAGGMHRQLPPVPTLFELCVQPVCTQLTLCGWYKGGAAEGLPAAQWPEAVRRVAIFELKRKGALTDELRAVLLAGPTPPVIDDEALLATIPNGQSEDPDPEDPNREEPLLTEEEDEERRRTHARWPPPEGGERTRPGGTRDISQSLPAELAEMEEEDRWRAREAEAPFGSEEEDGTEENGTLV